jgi:uncharacterized protein (DUF885 family)
MSFPSRVLRHIAGIASGAALLGAALPARAIAQTDVVRPSTSRVEVPPLRNAPAADRFMALYTREWNWRKAQFSGVDEDADPNTLPDRFPKVDAATQVERLRYWTDVLKELAAIPFAELSKDDQANYAIYKQQVETLHASARFKDYEKPFNSDSAFWSDVAGIARRPMRNAADYRRYVSLVNDIPRYFREQMVNMRAGLARDFSVPRVTLSGRDQPIAEIADAKNPEANPFYAPFQKLPASIGAAEAAELRAAGRAAVRDAANRAGRGIVPRWEGVLPVEDPRIHHPRPLARRDPQHRPRRSREDPVRDG